MEGMSERQYAARVGLSRGAIQKAKATGRLVLHVDGSVNAEASDARRAESDGPVQDQKTARTEAQTRPRGGGLRCRRHPARTRARRAACRQRHHVPAGQDRERGAEGAGTPHSAQKLKGELIERTRALSLVFRLARQERDVWVNWPSRAAALMAADLGVEPAAMQKILEKHVRAQLDGLAEVRPDLR